MNDAHCQHTLGFIGEKLQCRLLTCVTTVTKNVLLIECFVIRGKHGFTTCQGVIIPLKTLWSKQHIYRYVYLTVRDFRAMFVSEHQQEVLRKRFSTEFLIF